MPEPVSKYSEQELIEGCVRQDRMAQKALYDCYSRKMLAICIRYVGNKESAKDVLQEAFITVFDKIRSYKAEGSFEGWLRKIFVNASLMHIRKNDVLKYAEEIETVPLSAMGAAPVGTLEQIGAKQLMELIAAMPSGFRTVFNLYAVEGYSHAEIAAALGISEGSSRSQLSRARIWLKERLERV